MKLITYEGVDITTMSATELIILLFDIIYEKEEINHVPKNNHLNL